MMKLWTHSQFAIIAITLSYFVVAQARAAGPIELPLRIDFEEIEVAENTLCAPNNYLPLYGINFVRNATFYPVCKLKEGWAPFVQAMGSGNNSYIQDNQGGVTFLTTVIPKVDKVSFSLSGKIRDFTLGGSDPHSTLDLKVDAGTAADPVFVFGADHARITLVAKPGRSISGFTVTAITVPPTSTKVPIIVMDDFVIGGEVEVPQKPKIALGALNIIQSVPDFRLMASADRPETVDGVDLVLNKKTIIKLNYKASNVGSKGTTPVTITAKLGDGTEASAVFLLQDATSSTGKELLLSFIPKTTGKTDIRITVTATDVDVPPIEIKRAEIKKTLPMSFAYFPVSMKQGDSIEKPPTEDFATHITNSTLLMNEMFPVAPGDVKANTGAELSSSFGLPVAPDDIMMLDWLDVAFKTYLNSRTHNAGFGIVPEGYFSALGKNYLGVAPADRRHGKFLPLGSLVKINHWITPLHEYGHLVNRDHTESQQYASGYWFPGGHSLFLPDLMNAGVFGSQRNLLASWIGKDFYNTIFHRQLQNPIDPPILLIGGSIDKNGLVNLKPVKYFSDGIITNVDQDADGLVSGISSSGEIVSQAHYYKTFEIRGDSETGSEFSETNFSPLLVQLPFNDSVETVQITEDGKLLKEIDPNSQMLIDAVRSLSNSDFIRLPKIGKTLLLQQAEAIDNIRDFCRHPYPTYKKGWKKSVCTKLALWTVLTMRASAEALLKNTTPSDVEDVTRASILRTIDLVALHILPNLEVNARKSAFKIQVIPHLGCADRGTLKIKSFEQGIAGRVEQLNLSTLRYTPSSKNQLDDEIKATIVTPSGDTSIKTITINKDNEVVGNDDENYFDSATLTDRYFQTRGKRK